MSDPTVVDELEQLLNATPPPSTLDAGEVDAYLAQVFEPTRRALEHGLSGPRAFTYEREDGLAIEYRRWHDHDGDLFLSRGEFRRRIAHVRETGVAVIRPAA